MTPQISIRHLAVVHGRQPGAALRRADAGESPHAIRLGGEGAVAVIDVDLDVYPGEILVLVGGSGSGKTSLLAALDGSAEIARGSASFVTAHGPVELSTATKADRKRHGARTVAFARAPVPLPARRTVASVVTAHLARHGVSRRDRAPRAVLELASAGLRDAADMRIEDLPPGIRPQVQLLLAALGSEPILFLDTAIDTPDAWRDPALVNALRRLRERTDKTVILSSCDPAEALRVGDRVAVLDNGRLVQVGRPSDLVLQPASDHVAALLSELNPVGFLEAQDVMTPIAPEDEASGFAGLVQTGTPLAQVLPTLRRGDVVVAERGRLLGKIDARKLWALFA
ncbi:ATP-binding cassette domain-containing protein [Aureimonas sp. ME7]|uniref:ATP-binding cassette domain-containing protein n=1 Tax=Aureimonas sp. ME7 TaxID=2744252 RepID=UPI0015F507D1|nr:ATP-binding cassette domain-containing protein [Aureimonas sp. ME7]